MSRLKPTNDFLFKKLFGNQSNSELLKDLLEGVLPELNIKKVKVNKDVSLERQYITDKYGILDVIATLNDNIKINIEMQVKNYNNTIDRSIFYGAGYYREQLRKGDEYIKSPRTISIWITDYDVFNEGPFHEIARIRRDYGNIILTDKLEFHYIQLTKFREKCKRISSKLDEWLTFIINENLEAIKMSNNECIRKAEKEFEYLTGDEAIKRDAELREKFLRDQADAMGKARREGKEEGKNEKKIEIAKRMLAKNIDINMIMEITELSKEEIENL